MSFDQLDIQIFAGLDANTDPTLIKDYEGADIVNFRMEKIGKLVSRNGRDQGIVGFIDHPTNPERNMFMNTNEGVYGIGELILETVWEPIGTDRFMVYIIRGEAIDAVSSKKKAGIFFAPISGVNKRKMIFTIGIFDKIEYVTPLNKTSTRQLLASEQTRVEADAHKFIDEFVRMHEYRRQLIMSDRTNGDLRIVDSFDYADNPVHDLTLKENCLYDADIDVFQVDYQIGAGQANEDVEHGMALYKYILPKKTSKVSDPRFTATLSDPTWLGTNYDNALQKIFKLFNLDEYGYSLSRSYKTTTSSLLAWVFVHHTRLGGGHPGAYHSFFNLAFLNSWDTSTTRVFTNQNQAEEYYDVLGKLELAKDKYRDEKGEDVEEYASDVYIWNDLKLNYKPVSGIKQGSGNFLTDSDKLWDKTDKGLPRITKLRNLVGHEREVPVGGWSYRFVWDFGNGEYSAPTTTLTVSDVIYSALSDIDLQADNPAYERPFDLWGDEFITTTLSEKTETSGSPPYFYPKIWTNTGVTLESGTNSLTETGKLLWKVKNALYDVSFKYGGLFGSASALESDTNAGSNNYARRTESRFGTLITATYGAADVELTGLIGQYAFMAGHVMDPPGSVKFVVPIFKTPGLPHTYNSVFDDEGNLRFPFATQRILHFGAGNVPFLGQYVKLNDGSGDLVTDSNSMYEYYQFDGDDYSDLTHQRVDAVYLNFTLPISKHNYPKKRSDDSLRDTLFFRRSDGSVVSGEIREHDAYSVLGKGNLTYDGNTYTRHGSFYGTNVNSFTTDDANTVYEQPYDYNNLSDGSYDIPSIYDSFQKMRPDPTFKGVNSEQDKLTNVKPKVPTEARNRLLLQGIAGLQCLSTSKSYGLFGYNAYDHFPLDADRVNYDISKYFDIVTQERTKITPKYVMNKLKWPQLGFGGVTANLLMCDNNDIKSDFDAEQHWVDSANNLEVMIYGESQRLIALEQLSSYFPSSLLFGSPRIRLHVDTTHIPKGAKRLRIYRTTSSNRNDYDPKVYGLVKDLEIEYSDGSANYTRNNTYGGLTIIVPEGTPVFKASDIKIGETGYAIGVSFFDDIRDDNLDFNDSPEAYEGRRSPIKSAFNLPLNETHYYANYKETVKPPAPRGYMANFKHLI